MPTTDGVIVLTSAVGGALPVILLLLINLLSVDFSLGLIAIVVILSAGFNPGGSIVELKSIVFF